MWQALRGERKTLRFVARYAQACNLVARVWEVTPLEVIGGEVIPAVADL